MASSAGGVSTAASSPGSPEQAALLGPPAAPLPGGQTPLPWVEFLFVKKKTNKKKIQNESDETSLSRLISKARPCKELRCASGTSGTARSGRGRPRSAASLPLPKGQTEMEGGRSASAAGVLEVRPQRVPGTRWHLLGLAQGGEMGGFNCTKPARGPLHHHHHRALLAYPRPFQSMGTAEGIPNL